MCSRKSISSLSYPKHSVPRSGESRCHLEALPEEGVCVHSKYLSQKPARYPSAPHAQKGIHQAKAIASASTFLEAPRSSLRRSDLGTPRGTCSSINKLSSRLDTGAEKPSKPLSCSRRTRCARRKSASSVFQSKGHRFETDVTLDLSGGPC